MLTVTGDLVAVNGAGEPLTNIFVRLLIGLIYGFAGLTAVGGAIFGFPESPHSGGSSAGGDSGFDGDGWMGSTAS
ncbi:hypothetical protein [Lentzea waywayandensis]|uniref:hypothetical protein n=1 Tax=Lentzea waywayandensis TaxID=84724 RepID=UPI001160712F|nr:hypothetical protein [Lentzea waywayandensis]